jgi:hypothetical protein
VFRVRVSLNPSSPGYWPVNLTRGNIFFSRGLERCRPSLYEPRRHCLLLLFAGWSLSVIPLTAADLDHAETVSPKHVVEAVQYGSLDRNYWS